MFSVTTTTCTVDTIVGNVPLAMKCLATDDAPTWTDVFSAWGTVGATAAAVIFGAISLGLTLHERKLRRQQEKELATQAAAASRAAVRSQAEQVACWLQVDFLNHSHNVIVENASNEPIWDVTVQHHTLQRGTPVKVPVLVANGRKEISANPRAGWDFDQIVDVQFRDNAGNRWHRPTDAPGTLVLLSNDDAIDDEEVTVE